ncbi:MAG: response regulator [Limisphaerales bacterium]
MSASLPSDPPPELRPLTVAVVEDDAGCREELSSLLAHSPGFRAAGAFAEAASALHALAAAPPDLVIVDLALPDTPGDEFCRRLRALGVPTRPVIYTVHAEPWRIAGALEAGAFGYLLKETPPAELLQRLREAHAGGVPLSAPVALAVVQVFHRRGGLRNLLGEHHYQMLSRLAQGRLSNEIADELGLKPATVRAYLSEIYGKLHVRGASEAVALYHGGPAAGPPDGARRAGQQLRGGGAAGRAG